LIKHSRANLHSIKELGCIAAAALPVAADPTKGKLETL
jgi:hypothetical protein